MWAVDRPHTHRFLSFVSLPLDIFFTDPSEVPLPPEEVRIRNLRAEPWPDGRRVRIIMELDPSQKRPNADLAIENQQGKEVATVSIIESIDRHIEVTMHLRESHPEGKYQAAAKLFFTSFDENADPEPGLEPIEKFVVDEAQFEFKI